MTAKTFKGCVCNAECCHCSGASPAADRKRLQKDHIRLYLLFLPVAVWYIIFQYVPMGGLVIAFQDFKILKGIGASKFVGFDNFVYLFSCLVPAGHP